MRAHGAVNPCAAIAVALAACTAPRIEGSGARVQAGLPHGPRVAEIVREVEPKIIEILGTRWPWEYRVTIEQEAEGSVAWTRAWDRKVVLGPLSLSDDELPLALAHELAHVHMRAPWTDLPRVLQEGVAIWVSLLALDRTAEFGGPPPPRQLCLDVFTCPIPSSSTRTRNERTSSAMPPPGSQRGSCRACSR